ncbi:histidine phosphatase family protein [Hephaestia mangrovi]|uniref:histidine phosphatase family protein n=1 Tax=Hephaestia mangrovi TaxID=2873268 RepID=UPI001CA616E0|nr:histidine phosphatase family protein [Hephaestia mangrovi]MBY8829075.1 histidine phosphatase family protein [Hephaestia mangrovi]
MVSNRKGRDFIARHGETVFNAAGRMQGDHVHTPLTRAGFAQADEMGRALHQLLGDRPALSLWASPAGRALQTLAIITDHLGLDWHAARTDPRLVEIGTGSWSGRGYREIMDERGGTIVLPGGLLMCAPDGETYPEIAERVSGWLADTDDDESDRLIIMHGISSRVLRGVLTGAAVHPELGAPTASGLPQGSLVVIEAGRETIVHRGTGHAPA